MAAKARVGMLRYAKLACKPHFRPASMAKNIQFKTTSRKNIVERYLLTFDTSEDYDEAIKLCKERGFICFRNGGPHRLLGRPVRVSREDRAIEVDAAVDLGLSL